MAGPEDMPVCSSDLPRILRSIPDDGVPRHTRYGCSADDSCGISSFHFPTWPKGNGLVFLEENQVQDRMESGSPQGLAGRRK